MVEKITIPGTNIVDFSRYQQGRNSNAKANSSCKTVALSAPVCRHCGAALLEGENEDDCSSVGASRRFYAD
jgi:hypothetical protein